MKLRSFLTLFCLDLGLQAAALTARDEVYSTLLRLGMDKSLDCWCCIILEAGEAWIDVGWGVFLQLRVPGRQVCSYILGSPFSASSSFHDNWSVVLRVL